MMEGTVERNQLQSLASESIELVCECLCLGDMFASGEAVRSLWYECLRTMDVILSLARLLEPEIIVDDHAPDVGAAAATACTETTMHRGVDLLLKQVSELFNDAKTKAAKEGKEMDQNGAAELAEKCRHQFLALRPNSTVGAGAEQKRNEFLTVFSGCAEERRSQRREGGHPVWLTPDCSDPRYEQSLSASVQSHVSTVFQPVDK